LEGSAGSGSEVAVGAGTDGGDVIGWGLDVTDVVVVWSLQPNQPGVLQVVVLVDVVVVVVEVGVVVVTGLVVVTSSLQPNLVAS
jgi:hypothetical protein